MTPFEDWPESGPFRGREEVVREYRNLSESFGVNEVTPLANEEFGKWIVTDYCWVITGAQSGARQEVEFFAAGRVEDGLTQEVHFRFDREAALALAGG